MGRLATVRVPSHEDAIEAVVFLNAFHDSFTKRITITSQGQIEEDLRQGCQGNTLNNLGIVPAHRRQEASTTLEQALAV